MGHAVPGSVLITTDLDRTLIFSPRATSQLGGGLPADAVELSAGQSAAELGRAARDALTALPATAQICVATSRSVSRLARLRLPFAPRYAIAANGGVVLVDGAPDPQWAARIRQLLASAAPAALVRALLHGAPWLARMGDEDEMCVLAIAGESLLAPEELAVIADRCAELGWEASLIGRKLYAFPAGFGKEHAAAHVAEKVAREAGATPLRLAAGDTEHDRLMLADADQAWVPAGSELARSVAGARAGIDGWDRSGRDRSGSDHQGAGPCGGGADHQRVAGDLSQLVISSVASGGPVIVNSRPGSPAAGKTRRPAGSARRPAGSSILAV